MSRPGVDSGFDWHGRGRWPSNSWPFGAVLDLIAGKTPAQLPPGRIPSRSLRAQDHLPTQSTVTGFPRLSEVRKDQIRNSKSEIRNKLQIEMVQSPNRPRVWGIRPFDFWNCF